MLDPLHNGLLRVKLDAIWKRLQDISVVVVQLNSDCGISDKLSSTAQCEHKSIQCSISD